MLSPESRIENSGKAEVGFQADLQQRLVNA
jgi:hypothetical protein